MRNLEECKAEIFRRSEERIRQRRKIQQHMLMAGLLILFVSGTYFSIILPEKKSTNMNLVNEEDNVIWETQCQSASKVTTYDLVEIKSAEYQQKIMDTTEVMRIYETICYFCDADTVDILEPHEEYQEKKEESPQEVVEDDCQPESYRIIFSNKDGAQVTYVFMENELWNEKNGKVYRLTEAQACDLKNILYQMGMAPLSVDDE